MPLLKPLVFFLLCAATLDASADPLVTRVAYLPIGLEGDYRPLDEEAVAEMMLAGLKAGGEGLEFVPLAVNHTSSELQGEMESVLQAAQESGAELLVWGSVRFKRSALPSRGSSFYAGRLKLVITAEADVGVLRVADRSRLLSQPTIVSSTGQSRSFVEDGDPALEKKLARDSLQEASRSIVEVVRKRRAAAPATP